MTVDKRNDTSLQPSLAQKRWTHPRCHLLAPLILLAFQGTLIYALAERLDWQAPTGPFRPERPNWSRSRPNARR